MKINVPLPFDQIHDPAQFLTMDAVREVGSVIEESGFHAALVTDHPCPTGRWLDTGGHHAQSPFVMLALLGAVTTRIRLQTGILVLPYRNPLVVARDVATLDRYTSGRVTLSFGAGYLKAEYRAVGADFDRRNETMDEYMKALRLGLGGQEFAFKGTGYEAFGNRILPGPVQEALPFLVGGNSRRAIRRAVELGDGWNPFFTVKSSEIGEGVVRPKNSTTRTAAMESERDLADGIAYMQEQSAAAGRAKLPKVVLGSVRSPGEPWSPQQLVDRLGRLQAIGADAAAIYVDGETRGEWCDNARRVGEQIIAKL